MWRSLSIVEREYNDAVWGRKVAKSMGDVTSVERFNALIKVLEIERTNLIRYSRSKIKRVQQKVLKKPKYKPKHNHNVKSKRVIWLENAIKHSKGKKKILYQVQLDNELWKNWLTYAPDKKNANQNLQLIRQRQDQLKISKVKYGLKSPQYQHALRELAIANWTSLWSPPQKNKIDLQIPQDILAGINNWSFKNTIRNKFWIRGSWTETVNMTIVPSHWNESNNNTIYTEKQWKVNITFRNGVPVSMTANGLTNSYNWTSSYRAGFISRKNGLWVVIWLADWYTNATGFQPMWWFTYVKNFKRGNHWLSVAILHMPWVSWKRDSLTINWIEYRYKLW